jgi:hypothetical protein
MDSMNATVPYFCEIILCFATLRCSLWGQYVLDPEVLMSRTFFITLDTYENQWHGSLTIGQHSYLWSSADMGDAHLLDTDSYEFLEEALAALKAEIVSLFDALLPGQKVLEQ